MGTQSQHQVILPSFGELLLSIDLPGACPFSLPDDPSPGVTPHSRPKKQKNVLAQGDRYREATTISMLPDDVLLEIFDFFQPKSRFYIPKWHSLVHVCQRWRQVVFTSPLRLNLLIFCTHGTPVRKNLGIWQRLPIVLGYQFGPRSDLALDDEDNVIAALEHPDLVHFIGLELTGSQLGKIATTMRKPFPELLDLYLVITPLGWTVPTLPAEFLGGSAPCLHTINLWGVPFPSLPKLLLSAGDIVELLLHDIPPTGYISPEAMASCLAALPRLESYRTNFQSATPRPDRIGPPPPTRTVLPALSTFGFQGASEYLEVLVGRIDGPQLDSIDITYLNQLVDFQVAQLSKFIDRSVGPKLNGIVSAEVSFRDDRVTFKVRHDGNRLFKEWVPASTEIRCEGIDWQVSHMAQVLSQFPATLSAINHLALTAEFDDPPLEGMDDAEWPHLLHQFSAVKTLYVFQELAEHVALALEDIMGGIFAGALPSLDLIYLADQPTSSIEKFINIRQLSGRPVAVVDTGGEFFERLES